jgi:hypothetical protein
MPSYSLRSPRLLTAASAVVVFVACGGQQFVAGTGDGGSSGSSSGSSSGASSGGSSGSSSGSDGGACVTEPGDVGDEATFCGLEATLFTKCGECDACHQSDLNECAALGDSLSTAFKSALASCESQLLANHLCNNYSTYGTNPCVAAALTNSTKSSAQISAATTYCSKCAVTSGLSACVTDYFEPPQPDGGSAGVGYIVLLGNDTTAAAVQSACSSGLTCPATATYELCAVAQFCKAEPAEACSSTSDFCK